MPYKIVKADNGDAWVEVRGKKIAPPADLGASPAQDEEDRRGLPRRGGHRSRDHGAGLLQRLAAPGDQGRRPHRGPRGQAHHQRADRGRARVRPRQEAKATARSRSTTSAAARSTSRSSRSPTSTASTSSRCCRPTATRSSAARTSTSASSTTSSTEFKKEPGRRPAQGRARAAAPEGSGREGEDRAVVDAADRHQPAVHHGRRSRARST